MTMDDFISQLMEQGQGSTAPPPATNQAIDSLPRFKADRALVEGGKECTVCKDGFQINEDAIRLPCLHVLYAHTLFFLINCVVTKIVFYHGLKSTVPVLFVVILLMEEKHLMIHHHHLLTTLVRLHRHLHVPKDPDTIGQYQIYSISEAIGIQVRGHLMEVLLLGTRVGDVILCLLRKISIKYFHVRFLLHS
jgi:hypothetical protein